MWVNFEGSEVYILKTFASLKIVKCTSKQSFIICYEGHAITASLNTINSKFNIKDLLWSIVRLTLMRSLFPIALSTRFLLRNRMKFTQIQSLHHGRFSLILSTRLLCRSTSGEFFRAIIIAKFVILFKINVPSKEAKFCEVMRQLKIILYKNHIVSDL